MQAAQVATYADLSTILILIAMLIPWDFAVVVIKRHLATSMEAGHPHSQCKHCIVLLSIFSFSLMKSLFSFIKLL